MADKFPVGGSRTSFTSMADQFSVGGSRTRCDMLCKFFNSLDSSIRLLGLKCSLSTSTFTNLRPAVDCLSGMSFSYGRLAQLKHIFPEFIELKRVLVRDGKTCCMKPDLHISLNYDAIKSESKLNSMSVNFHMRNVFRSRVLDFFKSHPEEGEVPKVTLPHPFNTSTVDIHTNTSNASRSSSVIPETLTEEALPDLPPQRATHLPPTFRKHFSQQILPYATANTNQQKDTICLQPSVLPVSELHVDQSACTAQSSVSHPHMDPLKQSYYLENVLFYSSVGTTTTIQGTPAKLVSTPVKLMITTPAQNPSTSSGSKLTGRKRSLQFDSPMKKSTSGLELPENIVQSDLNEI